MARKPITKSPASQPPVEAPKSGEVIEDGDFAGMTYDDVAAMTVAAVEDAYGPLTIEGVCRVHDEVTANVMAVAKMARGDVWAQEVALKFGQTLMPYLLIDEPIAVNQSSYAELAKSRHNGKK